MFGWKRRSRGKSLIGIEVPNGKIGMVSFREIIEAQPNHPDKLLEVPLGRDVSGREYKRLTFRKCLTYL